MKCLILFISFLFVLCHYGEKIAGQVSNPDTYRNVSELITSEGYPLEEHTVVTDDGYILSMQRIPHGKNNATNGDGKEPVLLIHGEVGDGKTWFLNPPGQGLGYILPDAGYDVWIINCRGSDYSKKHVEYSNSNYFGRLKFWNFTIEDIALYDLPATIDYVLNATGKESLYAIGYSRGNTVGFAMLSELPEYNKKVRLLVALAPIAYIGHFKTIIRYAIPFKEPIASAINAVTQGEFIPRNKKLTKFITAKFCQTNNLGICRNFVYALAGKDTSKQLNETRLPLYLAQYPSSTSTKILYHFGQLYQSKKFRKFDYGFLLNLKHYNQLQPPDFKVSSITSPLALFWSTNDVIADPTDVGILRRQLNSLVFDYRVPEKYNHFDFIWAKDSPKLIYEPILQLFQQY